MTLAYCTNIWNHHQGPVCRELANLLGKDFKMLLHQPLDHKYSKERIALGWNLTPPDEPWIVRAPKSVANVDYSEHLHYFMEADVVIYNSELPYVSQEMLVARARNSKINMRMGERLFRHGRPWYWHLWPRKIVARCLMHHRFEAAGVHFLTMGHWCKSDLVYLHVCKNRIWRWGYLTAVSPKCPEKKSQGKVRIGWCGRMLYLKQVDLIIRAYALLPEDVRERSELILVGNGEAEDSLKELAVELKVINCVRFGPFKPQKDILKFLEGLDVFVFPSNKLEGWGATLVEAMDKGCAVVANSAAGSTLDVVEDGVNGFVFNDCDIAMLAKRIESLIRDCGLRERMGKAAWATIQEWSPRAGAERLCKLARGLHEKDEGLIPSEGLCANVR